MSSKNTSPYATSFKSAINRGTPCSVAVQNIAKRTKKSPTVVFNSLHKAGLCDRQKFNGQWIYWPSNCKKSSASAVKTCQWNMWQCFVDWCLASGYCTPEQLRKNATSQQAFMNFCKKFWSKQFSASTSRKSTTTTSKPRSRKSTPTTSNFKFPTVKSRTPSRRIRTAA